jgi:hypothetical protein
MEDPISPKTGFLSMLGFTLPKSLCESFFW